MVPSVGLMILPDTMTLLDSVILLDPVIHLDLITLSLVLGDPTLAPEECLHSALPSFPNHHVSVITVEC